MAETAADVLLGVLEDRGVSFDGFRRSREGGLRPDQSRPGFGLELKR